MNKKKFSLLFLSFCAFLCLKAQPPSWVTAEAAPDFYFKVNAGQVHDGNGTIQNDVQLYGGTHTMGKFFMEMGRVAHTHVNTATRWSCRVDVIAVCNGEREICGNMYAFDLTDEKTNYYDEYLVDGVLDVDNYKGIIHESAYPDVDIIYTSNRGGMVTIYQVKPGGDPENIALAFEGQAGINLTEDGHIELTTSGDPFILDQLEAYQVEDAGGELVSLGWKPNWSINSDNLAILTNFGAYDPNKELYLIDKPIGGDAPYTQDLTGIEWSTRYGDGEHKNKLDSPPFNFSHERGGTIRIDQTTGDIYHTMSTNYKGNEFQSTTGCEQKENAGGYDIFITKFLGDSYERKWGTYFGGAGDEFCAKMAISSNTDVNVNKDRFIYLTGYTTGEVPMPTGSNGGTFIQNNSNGGKEAFIASFDKTGGFRQWVTHFGGAGDDVATSITVDDIDHKLYIAGSSKYVNMSMPATTTLCTGSSGSGFPVCAGTGSGGRYFQGTYTATTGTFGADGFVAEFEIDQNINALDWSTLFGSNKTDEVFDVLKVNSNGEKAVYICGMTRGGNSTNSYPASTPLTAPLVAGDFPFANPGTANVYFQYTNLTSDDEEAFIAKFDENYKLAWSTQFGGSGSERFTSMATNKDDNSVFAVGLTTTDCIADPSTSGYVLAANDTWWPTCAKANEFIQKHLNTKSTTSGTDVMLTRFSNTGKLTWSTFFGGSYPEFYDGVDDEYTVYAQMEEGINNLYIYGTTTWYKTFSNNPNPTPVHSVTIPNYIYNQANNMSALVSSENPLQVASDVFVAAFNHNLIFAYGTHFGGWSHSGGAPLMSGQADEVARDFDIRNQDHGIFLTGGSASNGTPAKYPSVSQGSPYFKPFAPPSNQSASSFNTTPGDWNLFITHLHGDSWWASTGIRIGLDEQNQKVGKVSPNPMAQNTTAVTVELEVEAPQQARVSICDILGREYFKGDCTLTKGNNQLPLDVGKTGMGTGMYFVRIEGETFKKSITLVVE